MIKVRYFIIGRSETESTKEVNTWLDEHRREFVGDPEFIYTQLHESGLVLLAIHYHITDPEAEAT